MLDAPVPWVIRELAEARNPELVRLIDLGPAAVEGVLEAFRQPAELLDDMPLSLLALALERIGDPRAVPVLTEWLVQNFFAEVWWATDFVTHTIKVLDAHGGLDTEHFGYTVEQMLATIARGRSGAPAATGQAYRWWAEGRPVAQPPAVPRPAAEPAEPPACIHEVTVKGRDENEVPQEVKFKFKVLRRDIHDVLADPSTPENRRQRLQRLATDVEVADKNYYDGKYTPVDPTDLRASTKSNCGGKNTEIIINRLAEKKGLAIRLPEGAANTVIRDVGKIFGKEVSLTEVDDLTQVSHEKDGDSKHVEAPAEVRGDDVTFVSKDNLGPTRTHPVKRRGSVAEQFKPVTERYGTTPKFYQIDPNRIDDIEVDKKPCSCPLRHLPPPRSPAPRVVEDQIDLSDFFDCADEPSTTTTVTSTTTTTTTIGGTGPLLETATIDFARGRIQTVRLATGLLAGPAYRIAVSGTIAKMFARSGNVAHHDAQYCFEDTNMYCFRGSGSARDQPLDFAFETGDGRVLHPNGQELGGGKAYFDDLDGDGTASPYEDSHRYESRLRVPAESRLRVRTNFLSEFGESDGDTVSGSLVVQLYRDGS